MNATIGVRIENTFVQKLWSGARKNNVSSSLHKVVILDHIALIEGIVEWSLNFKYDLFVSDLYDTQIYSILSLLIYYQSTSY